MHVLQAISWKGDLAFNFGKELDSYCSHCCVITINKSKYSIGVALYPLSYSAKISQVSPIIVLKMVEMSLLLFLT